MQKPSTKKDNTLGQQQRLRTSKHLGLALNLIDAYINCLGHKGIIARYLTLKYIKKDNMLKAGFFSQLRMPKKEQAKIKGGLAPQKAKETSVGCS